MKRGIKNLGVIKAEWEPNVSDEVLKKPECDERLYYSPMVKIGGFDWRFTVDYVQTSQNRPDPKSYLAIFVHCSRSLNEVAVSQEDSNIEWTCLASSSFRIVSHSSQYPDVYRKSDEPDLYTSEENKGWGYNEFLLWNDIEKYTKNGLLTIEVKVEVKETYGTFFSQNDVIDSNANVKIQDKLFYVNKEYLMEHSSYFRAAFTRDFNEKKNQTVEINDIDPKDFDQLLQVICPQRKTITTDNIRQILPLADRLGFIHTLHQCGLFLMTNSLIASDDPGDLFWRICLADQYQLHWCIKDIVINSNMSNLDLLNDEYESLSNKAKVEVLEAIAIPQKLEPNTLINLPIQNFYAPDEEIEYVKSLVCIDCKHKKKCNCQSRHKKVFYVNKGIFFSYAPPLEQLQELFDVPERNEATQAHEHKRTRKRDSSSDIGPSSKNPKLVDDLLEKEEKMIELNIPSIIATADEFEELLNVIYPGRKEIVEENVVHILCLAKTLQMPDVTNYCEEFLIAKFLNPCETIPWDYFDFIKLADKFDLKELMGKLLKKMDVRNLQVIKQEIKFADIKHKTKSLLFDRLLELL